jgi:hypothetical protein
MTETMKIWLKELYLDAAKEHYGAARNEHLWALGSDTNEEAAQHECYADENRAFAMMLEDMANNIEEEPTNEN